MTSIGRIKSFVPFATGLLMLLITGCTCYLYEKPIPYNTPEAEDIPELTQGLYAISYANSKNDSIFLSVKKGNEGLISTIILRDIAKKPLNEEELKDFNQPPVKVKSFYDHDFFRENSDRIFEIKNRKYVVDKEKILNCEINLKKEWFKSGFGKHEGSLIVKNGKHAYFLNFSRLKYWFIVGLIPTEKSLKLKYYSLPYGESSELATDFISTSHASVALDSDSDGDYYLLKLKKKEIIDFFNKPGFFLTIDLTKVEQPSTSIGVVIAKVFITLIFILVVGGLLNSNKQFIEQTVIHERKYDAVIGDISIDSYKTTASMVIPFAILIIVLIGVFLFIFPNNWQDIFGQSPLDLDPWAAPKNPLSWQNASIFLIVITWVGWVNFRFTLDERLEELERHDVLYNECIQAEKEFLNSVNGFGINEEQKAINQTDKYNSILETVKFRYKHLAALVSMGNDGWAGFKHFAQLDYAYKNAKESYDVLVSKLTEYRNTFGTFRRYG